MKLFITLFILSAIMSTQLCYGNSIDGVNIGGTIRGKLVYSEGSPRGIVLFFFSEPKMEYMIDGLVITSDDGKFEINLPTGVYYIQAQIDINKNGQTDPGDLFFNYGGEKPVAVKPGDNITFNIGEKKNDPNNNQFDPLNGLPPDNKNNPTPSTFSDTFNSSSIPTTTQNSNAGSISGKVTVPGHSPAGTLILLFNDSTLKTLVTATEITSRDGKFNIVLNSKKEYYLQAFYDINGNKQIDEKDFSITYGGKTPVPVKCGDVIEIVFEKKEIKTQTPIGPVQTATQGPTVTQLPSQTTTPQVKPTSSGYSLPQEMSNNNTINHSNTATPSLPPDMGMTTKTPTQIPTPLQATPVISTEGLIKGKAILPKGATEAVIFVFSDINLKNFVTSCRATNGEFSIKLPDGDYYLQAFIDINKNQILDIDDILVTYTYETRMAPKLVKPGGEEIVIDLTKRTNNTYSGNIQEKEFTITGNIIWPDHLLSKGIVEAYADSSYQTVKARAVIDKQGGAFTLKVPEGKYFLSVVIDDNLDGQISVGDGMGVYGIKSISEGEGTPREVIVSGSNIKINIPITDFMDFSGKIVSITEYTQNINTPDPNINKDLQEYSGQIEGYEELSKDIKLKGKIYFSRGGNIYIFNTLNNSLQTIGQGTKPSASLSGDKVAYTGTHGEIILSRGGISETFKEAALSSYQNISVSPGGNYIAYQTGTEVNIIDLASKKEIKKVFSSDMTGGPFEITWLPEDKKIVYLRGGGRNDLRKQENNLSTTGNQNVNLSSYLPYDGFSKTGGMETKLDGKSTDGLFPIVTNITQQKKEKIPGIYLWDRKSQDSYFMDFKEYGTIGDICWSHKNPNLFIFSKGMPSQLWLGRLTDKGIEKTQLTIYGGSSPAWSPDGRYIIYINNGQLWILNIDSRKELPLIKDFQPIYGESPCWTN